MERIISKGDYFAVDALSILSQCRDLSSAVICSVFGVLVTARAREFCNSWKRDICFFAVSLDRVSCNSLI